MINFLKKRYFKNHTRHTEEIAENKYQVFTTKKVIAAEQGILDDLEDCSRCRGVVIFGLSGKKGETSADLYERILGGVFHTELGVATKSVKRV